MTTKVHTHSLQELTVKELKALCKENKIKGYSTLKKAELIELIITTLQPQAEELAQAMGESASEKVTSNTLRGRKLKRGNRTTHGEYGLNHYFDEQTYRIHALADGFAIPLFTINLASVPMVSLVKNGDTQSAVFDLGDQGHVTVAFQDCDQDKLFEALIELCNAFNDKELSDNAVEHFRLLEENQISLPEQKIFFIFFADIYIDIAIIEDGILRVWYKA